MRDPENPKEEKPKTEIPTLKHLSVKKYLQFKASVGLIKNLELSKQDIPGVQIMPEFAYEDSIGRKVYVALGQRQTMPWNEKKRQWKHFGPARLEIYEVNRKGAFLYETILSYRGGN